LEYVDGEKPAPPHPLANLVSSRDEQYDRWKLYANHRLHRQSSTELDNMSIAQCFNCKRYSLWISDRVVYPAFQTTYLPARDMPKTIQDDFLEAAEIVGSSARGAAALLRLCVQKLLVELGEKGTNINEDIASLVKKGLDPQIQMALDIVRVTGNKSVHPGEMKVDDDTSTAAALFGIVNFITDTMITRPKQLQSLYGNLPEGARKAIEKRDTKT
jgi:hypothetical protein